jgi:5-methyltetrahydrofolate--homocysteine methyltransferase
MQYQWLSTPREWFRLKPLVLARRKSPTPAQSILWNRLRARGLRRMRFKRQEVIGGFITDFFTREAMLSIVIEGRHVSGHLASGFARTRCLEAYGIVELRFRDEEVLEDIERVLQRIVDASIAQKRRLATMASTSVDGAPAEGR